MAKELFFDSEAREKMKRGVDTLANAVKVTLGPKGRNVIIDKKFGSPQITKDGVTVAKEIELEDAVENMGAQLVKEVASKTADQAGDGTTTATVLAQSIYTIGSKNVAAGANPMDLKKGIEKAVDAIVKDLKKQSRPITTSNEIAQVATISANNDSEIGKLATATYKGLKDLASSKSEKNTSGVSEATTNAAIARYNKISGYGTESLSNASNPNQTLTSAIGETNRTSKDDVTFTLKIDAPPGVNEQYLEQIFKTEKFKQMIYTYIQQKNIELEKTKR